MKKIIFGGMVVMALLLTACKKNSEVQNLVNVPMTSDQMFKKISSNDIELEKGKALVVNYEYDSRTGLYKIIDFKQAIPEASIIEDSRIIVETMKKEKALSYTYTVKCDMGNVKKNWSKKCSGAYSCAGIIDDCLQAGGCATICQNKLMYSPDALTFYVDGEFSSTPTSIY